MDIMSNPENGQQNQVLPSAHPSKKLFDTMHLHFPQFKHSHPPVVDVNEIADAQMTRGQKIADAVASTVGSWRFIIIQSSILLLWLIINSIAWAYRWDPYPFILLNLALSFQAAYSAPFVMMSQNRQSEKDRLTAQNDYSTDCKGEEEVRHIMEHLDHQDSLTFQMVKSLETQGERLAGQEKLTLEIMQYLTGQNERLKAQHEEMMVHLKRFDPATALQFETKAQDGAAGEYTE